MIKLYKLGLSELFECQLDSEAYAFFAQYRGMVEWWAVRGKESTSSFRELRNRFYGDWRVDWAGYNSQHAQTSSLVAHNVLKSKVQPVEEVLRGSSFVVVSPRIARIEGERLVFPTRQAKKAYVRLVPKNSSQKVLLEQVQNKYWQLGQVFLTPKWCAIPLMRFLDLTKEKDTCVQALLK